jgi:hypothetical protein
LEYIVHSESLDDDAVFSKSFDIQDVNINNALCINKGNLQRYAVENAGHHGDLALDILIPV